MPQALTAEVMTHELLPELATFECGGEEYHRDLSKWIQGPCFESMETYGTSVWIFRDDSGEIVGYGSLATHLWRIPYPDSEQQEVMLIPMVALRTKFQGQPPGDPEERYSWAIFDFLITEARKSGRKFLVLMVQKDNARAIRFYERIGFRLLSRKPLKNGHFRMVMDISVEPESAEAETAAPKAER